MWVHRHFAVKCSVQESSHESTQSTRISQGLFEIWVFQFRIFTLIRFIDYKYKSCLKNKVLNLPGFLYTPASSVSPSLKFPGQQRHFALLCGLLPTDLGPVPSSGEHFSAHYAYPIVIVIVIFSRKDCARGVSPLRDLPRRTTEKSRQHRVLSRRFLPQPLCLLIFSPVRTSGTQVTGTWYNTHRD